MLKPIRERRESGSQSGRLVGLNAAKLTRALNSHRSGNLKSDCRPADIASARSWLAEAAPVADVLTMLESRHRFELSSADCRAYATEILWAAQHLSANDSEPIPYPKESTHATA